MHTDTPTDLSPLAFERLLRHEVASRRAQGMSAPCIAAELGLLPEVVDLVLSTPAPLRRCRP
jgi:hypothetical protein